MKKPTMQDIANELSTSRITVWKALNNRPGVSSKLRHEILTRAKELGYLSEETELPLANTVASRTIAAVVSRPESSVFWMEIIHELAKTLSEQGINLMYTYLPTSYKPGYALPSVLTDGSVSGMIVLNIYAKQLLEKLAALPLPKVFLDTVPDLPFAKLNGNLVILEGRCLVKEITSRLLESGRGRLGFIGDVDYAQTNTDRFQGFLDAFEEKSLSPDLSLSLLGPFGFRTHYEEICRFICNLDSLPEAFVCASDYIADFVQLCFNEYNLNPQGKIILTGFDNNTEYANVAGRLTTVDVQTKSLGARLANHILFKIDYPASSPELSYISSDILYRGILLN
ncbi:LacI family DNA-binding transcriptional regulator [Scatolibacter rhodanostii]|uniref:LacI family DNA-binding transcriptional regulator n=1 Tax=Scatolibacter rhodanostii TaxID=2014781 RepID=UPI000C0765A3|nr:LacI family DNA-binding transcriptional regulator [Scatolibacter rhodanostii]